MFASPRGFGSTVKGNEFELKVTNHCAFPPYLARA